MGRKRVKRAEQVPPEKVDVLAKLRERYAQLHPLLFQRSVERSRSLGELFDILDDCPEVYPVVWNQETRRWEATRDLFQVECWKKQG